MKLDDLLKDTLRTPGPGRDDLEAVRAAARAELRGGKPVAPWPKQLAALLGIVGGIAVGAAGVLLASGQTTASVIAGHGAQVLTLMAVAVVAGIAALRPNSPGRWIAMAAGAVGAASLVFLRVPGGPESPTPWMCTVSHLGAGLVPVVVAVMLLRGSARSVTKALLAGIAAGCTGALLGELGCEQSALHVAIWHLGAWALVIAATVAVSRRIKPRSYAP